MGGVTLHGEGIDEAIWGREKEAAHPALSTLPAGNPCTLPGVKLHGEEMRQSGEGRRRQHTQPYPPSLQAMLPSF